MPLLYMCVLVVLWSGRWVVVWWGETNGNSGSADEVRDEIHTGMHGF